MNSSAKSYFLVQTMQQFTEPLVPQEALTDSDGDDSRPEDGERQQYMFIWNSKYEVCEYVCVTGWERLYGIHC